MTGAPSGGTSLAQSEASAKASRLRDAAMALAPRSMRVGTGAAKKRAPAVLRLLHLLALTIVTVVVGAGITSHGWTTTTLLAGPIDVVAARDDADAQRAPSTPERRHQWRDRAEGPAVDLRAVEADPDNEDPLCDVADEPVPVFPCVPVVRDPDRAFRAELQVDTSRFAAGTGLPRGPPV